MKIRICLALLASLCLAAAIAVGCTRPSTDDASTPASSGSARKYGAIPPYGPAGTCDAGAGHVCGTFPDQLHVAHGPLGALKVLGSLPDGAIAYIDAGGGGGSLDGAITNLTAQPPLYVQRHLGDASISFADGSAPIMGVYGQGPVGVFSNGTNRLVEVLPGKSGQVLKTIADAATWVDATSASLQKDCVSSSGDGGTNLTCVMASGTDAGTYTVAAPQVVNDGTYTNQLGPILTTDGGTMAWTLPPGASGLLDTYVMGQLYAADAGPNFGYSKWECGVGLLGNGCRFSSPCTAMQSWIASDAGFATGWTTTVSLASLDAGGCQERVSVSAPGYPVMWGGLSQFAGVPPWPSSLPPAGFSEWLSADQGYWWNGTNGGTWTNQATGADVWTLSGNSGGCAPTTINGHAAVAFPPPPGSTPGSTCTASASVQWDTMTSGGQCWTIGAIYTYTGTLCGSNCPLLDLAHSGPLFYDGEGWAGLYVGNLGTYGANAAGFAAQQTQPGTYLYSQKNGNAGGTANPHYAIGTYCHGQLQSYLDGVGGPIVASSGGLTYSNIPVLGYGANNTYYWGAIRTVVVYPSQPSISALNAWLKWYGGF
jgi:hypothetical protein